MAWFDMAWLGLIWSGLAWLGLVWLSLAWVNLAWPGVALHSVAGKICSFLGGRFDDKTIQQGEVTSEHSKCSKTLARLHGSKALILRCFVFCAVFVFSCSIVTETA